MRLRKVAGTRPSPLVDLGNHPLDAHGVPVGYAPRKAADPLLAFLHTYGYLLLPPSEVGRPNDLSLDAAHIMVLLPRGSFCCRVDFLPDTPDNWFTV